MSSTVSHPQDQLIRSLFNLPPSRTVFTKSQSAYAEVRKAIVTHSLPASQPMDEAYLQSLFPYGRTPLREALKRLSHEGLLSWPSHQAPSVRDVSMHEMQYLYETRRMLEPTIAVLAARRATEHDLDRIEYCKNELIRASESGDIYYSVERDYALHAAIAAASQNPFLAEASNNLNLQSLRLWYRNQTAHGIQRIHEMHSELVETIFSGNEVKAEELALQHIASSLKRQTSALRELSAQISK